MSQLSLVVHFELKPGKREAFLEIIKTHAAGTLAEEEGCERFEVCVPQEAPNRVWLYEQYADAAALETHKRSPRLARTRESYAPLVESREIDVCEVQAL